MRAARSTVRLVSGYFVPAREGTDVLASLASRGVDVQVATNGFAVTDVKIVHAGYSKRRKTLLREGVRLYEVRPRGGAAGTGAEPEAERSPQAGSRFSGAGEGLHAKTFTIDGERLFVGSFNFDPRSAQLNTEMGLLIESAALAQSLDRALDARIPASTYSLRLDEDGRLAWVEPGAGGPIVHEEEPHMSFMNKTAVALLSLLPIEWLL